MCMLSASALAAVATGVFVRLFGHAWYAAESLVPALACQAIIFVGSQIAMTRYRSCLRPAVLRRFWLVLIGTGYGTMLLGVVLGGAPALETSLWVSNALTFALAVGAVAGFERRRRLSLPH